MYTVGCLQNSKFPIYNYTGDIIAECLNLSDAEFIVKSLNDDESCNKIDSNLEENFLQLRNKKVEGFVEINDTTSYKDVILLLVYVLFLLLFLLIFFFIFGSIAFFLIKLFRQNV